ncbi:hypothetical protein D3C78_1872930 [compost metagenome]
MQRVQLDAVHPAVHHLLQGRQMVGGRFPWQPNNQMAADLQPAFTRQPGGVLITGEIMAAIDAFQCFIVRGL